MYKIKEVKTYRDYTFGQFIWTLLCKMTRNHRISLVYEGRDGKYEMCNRCKLAIITQQYKIKE
jgi:hypothetical protein